jgi:hypothetical protein
VATRLDHLAKTLQIPQKQPHSVYERPDMAVVRREWPRKAQRGTHWVPLYSKAMGLKGARPALEIEVLPFVAHVFHPFASKPRLGIPHKFDAENFLVAGNFVAQLRGNLCICTETCAINTWGFGAINE